MLKKGESNYGLSKNGKSNYGMSKADDSNQGLLEEDECSDAQNDLNLRISHILAVTVSFDATLCKISKVL